jgi:ribose 5-phosphate isomerase A
MDPHEEEKRVAGEAAAALVEPGMRLGLGTGTTMAHFLAALARRGPAGLTCVATSPQTEEAARRLGLPLDPFDRLDRLDLAVDGADQVDPDLWLVKGGGGAHTREKVVAASADRFVVIVSSDKLVERLHPPVPLEVMRFGLQATLRRLSDLGRVEIRDDLSPTPDGNLIVDLHGSIGDPAVRSAALDAVIGVVDHGLYSPDMVWELMIGRPGGQVDHRGGADRPR